MMRAVLLALLAGIALSERITEQEDMIEPRLRMIDHSPPVGIMRGAAQSFQDVDPNFDETISFSVNTRGELGPSRAPLMCTCKVIAVGDDIAEDQDIETVGPARGRQMQKRAYSAPELREHVPLVTNEYARDHEDISFGVNVRGEDGPGFRPTWCNCQILQAQGRAPMRGGVMEQDDVEDSDEGDSPSNTRGPVRFARGHAGRPSADSPDPVMPHRLPVASGQAAEAVPMARPPTPIQLATASMNLQLSEGAAMHVSIPVGTNRHEGRDNIRRHRWSTTGGVPDGSSNNSSANATATVDDAELSTAESADSSADASSIQANATASATALDEPSPSPSSLPSPPPLSPSVSSSPSGSDDNDEDAVTALRHLAQSHPHASALLAQAIQAAAAQQAEQTRLLEEELAKRDLAIKQLAAENEKTQSQLKYVLQLEQMRLMTESPSLSASVSPSPSPSASPSPSSSVTPSPSPSPQIEWVPHEHHHHHAPRPNKKACYRTCRDTECSSLFDTSLRQYASCMDQCAVKCYGSQ